MTESRPVSLLHLIFLFAMFPVWKLDRIALEGHHMGCFLTFPCGTSSRIVMMVFRRLSASPTLPPWSSFFQV